MNNIKPKILYLYKTGRSFIFKNKDYSNDFLYGYDFLEKRGYDVDFLDILDLKIKYSLFSNLKTKILAYYFNLNSNYQELSVISEKINKYDILICTTNSIAFAASSLKQKKIIFPKIIFINQGILSRIYNLKIKSLKYYLLKKYFDKNFSSISLIIHLGKPELIYFNSIFAKYEYKSFYIPFAVDDIFWKYKEYKFNERKYFLFIGNDLNRDFILLERLVKNNPSINFLFVTNKIFGSHSNLKQIQGHLTKKLLTDKDILNCYHGAIATLIPLKNTLQPSGQSVLLQSLSTGTPVIISKFDGFFDNKFKNLENCIITDNSNFNKTLNDYLSLDLLLINSISCNGRKTIEENFNLDKVYTEFENKILSI